MSYILEFYLGLFCWLATLNQFKPALAKGRDNIDVSNLRRRMKLNIWNNANIILMSNSSLSSKIPFLYFLSQWHQHLIAFLCSIIQSRDPRRHWVIQCQVQNFQSNTQAVSSRVHCTPLQSPEVYKLPKKS